MTQVAPVIVAYCGSAVAADPATKAIVSNAEPKQEVNHTLIAHLVNKNDKSLVAFYFNCGIRYFVIVLLVLVTLATCGWVLHWCNCTLAARHKM